MVDRKVSLAMAFALAMSAPCGTAVAGDNNVLRVIQDNTLVGSEGNSLYVDQSAATFSSVVGPSGDLVGAVNDLEGQGDPENHLSLDQLTRQASNPDSTVVQRGSRNTASVTMTGDGGEIQLLQNNVGTAFLGNRATISADGDALGAVLQIGDDNSATLDIASGGKGLIAQNGIGNDGSLTVESGGSGKLVQNGNRSFYPVSVSQNTSVTVVQNGNGLQPVGIAAMQVFSTNPGTITITQTGF